MTNPTIIAVAGTDTEIGKTTVTCALLRLLDRRGFDVRGIKPVESGTIDQPSPEHEDGRRLAAASGQSQPLEALQRLKAPLAPPVAAQDEGVELRPERWMEVIRDVGASADLTFVEGAGGLLSPLADGVDTRRMAVELGTPVLLVAADSLGTLNHTFLTLEAIEAAGCPVVGVVFSAPLEADSSTGRNASVVARRYQRLPVAELPRIDSDDQGADDLEASGFADELLRRLDELG